MSNGNGAAVELRPVATPGRIGQATAVEQSRAVAEVQAAVIVAQQCPRSVRAAVEAMEEACGQIELAARAFFRYPRAGETVSGPSVHLARELARCWGNLQHGITELSRDDVHGQSEMKAWAWDLQTNTTSSNTFIVEHKRDTRQGVKDLTDQRDIYENNANNGARRLREAIFSVLPAWYCAKAQALCQQTIEGGGGKPLPVRIAEAMKAFEKLRVSPARIAAKFGHDSADGLTATDVAQLAVIYDSLKQGTVTVDDEFPAEPDRITADSLAPPNVPPAETNSPDGTADAAGSAGGTPGRPPAKITGGQLDNLKKERRRLGYGDSPEDWDGWFADLGRLAGLNTPIADPGELTQAEAKRALDQLKGLDMQGLHRLLDNGEVPDA